MDDRAFLYQGASIILVSLPVLFLLLPAHTKSRVIGWIVPSKAPDSSTQPVTTTRAPASQSLESEHARDTTSSEQQDTTSKAGPSAAQSTISSSATPTISTSSHDDTSDDGSTTITASISKVAASKMEPSFDMSSRTSTPATASGSDAVGASRSSLRSESNKTTPADAAKSAKGMMPPPPRPQAKTSSGAASLAPPKLSNTPSRTSNLAQRNNPQARRGPASSLAPPTTNGSLAPQSKPSTSTLPAQARPRQKVILSPGHSPLDWAHLTSSTSQHELAGVPHLLRVTPSQLAQMNGRKGRPVWSAYKGRVYNIGPYLDFHPGGVGELRRGAGKSGDKLFDEIHPWVNVESMLGSCLVGLLVSETENGAPPDEGLDSLD